MTLIHGITSAGIIVPVLVDDLGNVQTEGTVSIIPHNFLDGSIHPDTVQGTPLEGDLVVGVDQGAGVIKWQRLARGTSGQVLKVQADNSLAWENSSAGALIQEVTTQTGALDTTTAAIPADDTIPQNTEGKEIFTVTITPTSAANILRFNVAFFGASSGIDVVVIALFQDTTADALAAGFMYAPVAGHIGTIAFNHKMTAGTTSATTFKVRMGTNGGSTLTLNGSASARKLGGVLASSISVRESTS